MSKENNASHVIKKLRQLGATKYAIAKECGVSWQTVHMWELGVFAPKESYSTKLQELLTHFEAHPGKTRKQKLLDELAKIEEEEKRLISAGE